MTKIKFGYFHSLNFYCLVIQATETVEGIILDLANSKEVYFEAEAFVRMTKLRLLKIHCNRSMVNASWEDRSHTNDDCKQHMSGDLKIFSHELRCLRWHGCPLKSLPSNFHPKNLIDLEMPYSQIEQLWVGTKVQYSFFICFF